MKEVDIKKTADDVDEAISKASTKEEFIYLLQRKGYSIRWTNKSQSISFVNSAGQRIRNTRLDYFTKLDCSTNGLKQRFNICSEVEPPKKRQNTYLNKKKFPRYYIYVLQLTDGCFYIGKSVDITRRRKEHLVKRQETLWTKLHKAIGIVSITDLGIVSSEESDFYENVKTLEYMLLYGVTNVRGGYFHKSRTEDTIFSLHRYGFSVKDDKPVPINEIADNFIYSIQKMKSFPVAFPNDDEDQYFFDFSLRTTTLAKTACFLDNRDKNINKNLIKDRIETEVIKLFNEGIIYYGLGGEGEFNYISSEILFYLRDSMKLPIKIILVVPFENYIESFTNEEKERFAELLPKYDKVVYGRHIELETAIHLRDKHLVDNASVCITYCKKNPADEDPVINYAKDEWKKIVYIEK